MDPQFPKVNYIGNKRKIVDWIVDNFPIKEGKVLDLFAGGSSVSFELKKRNFEVTANDALYASLVVNKALIENKTTTLNKNDIEKALKRDTDINLREKLRWLDNNLFYETEVDELAQLVSYSKKITGYKKFVLQSLIRRAMIRKLPYSRMNIDWRNIVKLRDEEYSYKKYGRKRAYHNESFENHILKDLDSYNEAVFDNGKNNKAIQMDGLEAIKKYGNVDLIYIDPPYPGTMNKYNEFYGTFDQIYNKNIEYTDLTSSSNFLIYLENLVEEASKKAKYLALSLNSRSVPNINEVENLLEFYGEVTVLEKKHSYQVSGKENKKENYEILALVTLYK
ncbi:MAG: DNA adenine methylase [Carnobacterium sp.]|nr:DNA adenine methylase [Carnobacterium sp.]